ncbi:SDR family NAD(P)-dependent oxidoreductase [Chitinophaga solisilvae]|uniref:SDR family NAD(P)-dependent oxidoreductase n=1 Tax=Chitinophaga solisilvae TaxID=1233460 RepID=UPI00136B253F|nr:SDR family oxidoreductase [Chitinophaga solisilvae]
MLKDKVILLTGGADGIGWECAVAFAKSGAAVCIADINEGGRDRIAELPGSGHLFRRCDVTSVTDVKETISAITALHGRLDAVHNNAGLAKPSSPLHDTTEEEWQALMDVNLKSIYLTTRFAFPHLRESKGSILSTTSLVGTIGQNNHAAYVATKGAVSALTKAMALDYAPYGIRVNAVAPAAVSTPMLEKWSSEQPNADVMQQYLDRLHPLGPMPEGDVIADACVFLLSHAARFITGCILPVSGGAELGYRTCPF